MLADVFDALGSRRCYKEPWPAEDIRAVHDPSSAGGSSIRKLIDRLLANWDEALAIRKLLPDR